MGAFLAGINMPGPQFIPLENPFPIVKWMTNSITKGKTPYLLTYPSSALRVCQSALQAGISLEGAQMTVAGEPCTQTRMDFMRSTGAAVLPKYGIMETGPVGYGCLSPGFCDDIHVLDDIHAIIQTEESNEDERLRENSILFSSLMPTAPLVMLNVSMGDQAFLSRRRCQCPLEKLGWKLHMHTIRSFEKLTCGGMNFLDSDVMRVLDEILPARFGGSPTDYQLVEEDDDSGEPILRLIARPGLGMIDKRALIDAFIEGISRSDNTQRVMGMALSLGNRVRVERREPFKTRSGKILHLHVKNPTRPGEQLNEVM
jgi:hypothetical protein